MPRAPTRAYWNRWLGRWDAQQEAVVPARERRFHLMMDVLEAAVGSAPRVLDLGSGPGPLSLRVLRRFPRARCVAVDYDPVVLRIGRGALGSYHGRLQWLDTKIGAPGWTDRLPYRRFDAAVSTTALHWLPPTTLRQTYRDLARVLRPGGVFVNGDHLPESPRDAEIQRLVRRIYRVHRHGRPREKGREPWTRWWKEAARAPPLAESFAEHERRHAQHPRVKALPLPGQVAALRRAGFRTTMTVWQVLEDRVLVAIR